MSTTSAKHPSSTLTYPAITPTAPPTEVGGPLDLLKGVLGISGSTAPPASPEDDSEQRLQNRAESFTTPFQRPLSERLDDVKVALGFSTRLLRYLDSYDEPNSHAFGEWVKQEISQVYGVPDTAFGPAPDTAHSKRQGSSVKPQDGRGPCQSALDELVSLVDAHAASNANAERFTSGNRPNGGSEVPDPGLEKELISSSRHARTVESAISRHIGDGGLGGSQRHTTHALPVRQGSTARERSPSPTEIKSQRQRQHDAERAGVHAEVSRTVSIMKFATGSISGGYV